MARDGFLEGYVERKPAEPPPVVFAVSNVSEAAENDIDIGNEPVSAETFDELTSGESNVEATEDV